MDCDSVSGATADGQRLLFRQAWFWTVTIQGELLYRVENIIVNDTSFHLKNDTKTVLFCEKFSGIIFTVKIFQFKLPEWWQILTRFHDQLNAHLEEQVAFKLNHRSPTNEATLHAEGLEFLKNLFTNEPNESKLNYAYCILVHVKNRQIWIKHLRQQWVWRGILFLLLVHLFFVFLESRFPRKSLATLRAVKRSSFLVCGRMTPHIRPVRERSIAHRALVRLFTSVNPQVALQQPRPAELFAAKFALAWQFVSSDVLFEEWKWVENQRAVFARVFLIGIRRGRDC